MIHSTCYIKAIYWKRPTLILLSSLSLNHLRSPLSTELAIVYLMLYTGGKERVRVRNAYGTFLAQLANGGGGGGGADTKKSVALFEFLLHANEV
jgi:hypothetical protein